MSEQTTILAAIASSDFFDKIEPLINRSSLKVTRVQSGYHALTLAQETAYDLLLTQHPLPDIGFREFFSAVRSRDSASTQSPILILTRDDRLEPLSQYLEGSRTQACCIDAAPEQLEMALMELVGIALRTAARLGVDLKARLDDKVLERFCQTINVSESGLLLRYRSTLPIDSEVSLVVHLPGGVEPVQGFGQVVRNTDPEIEGVRGIGVRLLSLEGDGRGRLAEFVKRQLASEG